VPTASVAIIEAGKAKAKVDEIAGKISKLRAGK
jgi:hypothetical protein